MPPRALRFHTSYADICAYPEVGDVSRSVRRRFPAKRDALEYALDRLYRTTGLTPERKLWRCVFRDIFGGEEYDRAWALSQEELRERAARWNPDAELRWHRDLLQRAQRERGNPMAQNKAEKRYTSSHWGIEPTKRYEYNDVRLPAKLVEMGKMREVQLMGGDIIKFSASDQCILAFSDDKVERLFVIMPKRYRETCKKHLIDPKAPWRKLGDVAREVGGRQADWSYPDVAVQVVGVMKAIVYKTWKKGDDDEIGGSEYIHRHGDRSEGSGIRPVVCIAEDGTLWLAGGSYKVEDAGITG